MRRFALLRFWHPNASGAFRRTPRAGSGRAWGLALTALFFLLGLATLDDCGITWDEEASYTAGVRNLAIIRAFLTGQERPPWFAHEIVGYQFVFDSLRALFATQLETHLSVPGWIAFHLFNLLLASSSLWLLHRLILELTGSSRLAALGALSLVAFPKFLAHSQNNPKDLIGLFCFEAALLLLVRAACRPLRSSVTAGLGLGLALANHVLVVLVIPIAAFWMLARGEGRWRRRCLRLAVVSAVAPPAALICWPWFWQDTWERVQETVARRSTFQPTDQPVLYLGTI